MTTFFQYKSDNPNGSFAEYCRKNLLEICKQAAPNSISVTEIKNYFLRIDPDNPAWEEIAPGAKGTDKKYRHTIGMELDKLTNIELSNWKNKNYRYLSEQDKTRMHLDPHVVWNEVLRNSRSAAINNEYCISPDGKKQFRFFVEGEKFETYVYTQTSADKSLIKREAVEKIVKSINVEPNGIVQRGWRPIALRSAIVHCCNSLKFDNEGWIVVDKKRHYVGGVETELTNIEEELPNPSDIRGLVQSSMQRAKGGSSVSTRNRKKIPHDINDDDWISEKEKLTHCEVTGIAFDLDFRGPYQRSLDQRIPGLGYTKENTDVVVLIYNYAKNKFESKEVLDFCLQFANNNLQR